MWWVFGLVFLVSLITWVAYKADLEQFLDLVSVLRECVHNAVCDSKLQPEPAPQPLKPSVTTAVVKDSVAV